MNIRPFFKTIWRWTKHNSTKLLAAGAITAEALGFYFMHKEAPIVRDRLDALPEDAKWTEKVKAAGPVYLPAIGMLILSTGCIVGSVAMGERKAAIMASLYSASEASLRRLEKKVVEELGPDKAKELHDKAVRELPEPTADPDPSDIICTGKGNQLCFEAMTGQWFRSSLPAIENDSATFNKFIIRNCWAEFNDWLTDGLGLERAKLGDYVGFNLDHLVVLNITDSHRTVDGESYHIIDYIDGPIMYNGKMGTEFRRCEDCYPD